MFYKQIQHWICNTLVNSHRTFIVEVEVEEGGSERVEALPVNILWMVGHPGFQDTLQPVTKNYMETSNTGLERRANENESDRLTSCVQTETT